MANDFNKFSFNTSGYQEAGPITKTIPASSVAVEVATFDLTSLSDYVTVSIKVAGSALSGLEIYVRGDSNGEWLPLTLDQIDAYGRSDSGADVTTTPIGVTGTVMVARRGWEKLQLRAKSAAAATLTITAGGK